MERPRRKACRGSLNYRRISGKRYRIGSGKRAPEIEKEYAAKFKARVEELLDGVYEVPEERIALEAAIFADKANITEELVRLESHVSQLRGFLREQLTPKP